MSWHTMVCETIHHSLAKWREARTRFESMVTRADPGRPGAAQEIEDAAAEMAEHAETLVAAVRDLEKARRLDKEKRLERSRQ